MSLVYDRCILQRSMFVLTLTCRLDPLQGIDAISEMFHSLRRKVLRGLDLQQEDRGCDIDRVGL